MRTKYLSGPVRAILTGLCLLAAFPLGAASDAGVVRRFGIFVGANDGGPERARLQWAVSDAQRMRQVMLELGGLAVDDSLLLVEPKQADIQRMLVMMRNQVAAAQGDARRVEFMFYYSGHSDEEGLLLGDERFPYRALRQTINDVKADVTIAVLDSCASGAFTRQKGGVRVQPFLADASTDMRGYAFLTSASENEAAQESDRLGASYFTHYFVSALRGAASNGGTRVTLNEAYRYAFNETLARTETTSNGPQHPSYDISLSGTGDLVLSDLSQPSAALVLKDDLAGRVFVRDQRNTLVMEANKAAGSALTLALQPGSYTIRIETATGVFQAPAKLAFRQQYPIGLADFKRAPITVARSRGSAPAGEPASAATPPAPASPADAAFDLLDNVLEQARARYARRNAEPPAPSAAEAEPAAEAPSVPAEPALADSEGIGTWESISLIAPPAAAAPSPAPSPRAPREPVLARETEDDGTITRVGFHFMAFPGLDSVRGRNVASDITLSPTIGVAAGNTVLMASLLMNFTGGLEQGIQVSTLLNRAGKLDGAQLALANLAGSDSDGFQGGALFNHGAGAFEGVQLAGLFNAAAGSLGGMQGAGLFNIAGGLSEGLQLAGLFNLASGGLTGVQLAGLVNLSGGTVSGAQVAGIANIGYKAHGVMVAPVNIVQDFDGLPIGLVNVVANGIHDISFWYGLTDRAWLGFLNGSSTFYSIVSAGWDFTAKPEELRGLAIGLGVGARLRPADVLFVDLEGSIKRMSSGSSAQERAASLFQASPDELAGKGYNFVPSLRLNGGVDLKPFKIFAGLNADLLVDGLMSAAAYSRDLARGWQGIELFDGLAASASLNLGASVSF